MRLRPSKILPALLLPMAFFGLAGTASAATNITISSSPTSGVVFSGGSPNVVTPIEPAAPASGNVNVSDLVTALGSAPVQVYTVSSGPSLGAIAVNNPVTWTGSNSLSLHAGGALTFNAALTAPANFDADAGAGISQAATPTAPLSVAGTAVFNADTANLAGNIALNDPTNDFGVALKVANTSTVVTNDITIADANSVHLYTTTAAVRNLTINAGGDVDQVFGPISVASGDLVVNTSGDVTLTDTGNDFNRLAANADDVSVKDTNALGLTTSAIGGNLTASAPGGISQVTGSSVSVAGTALLNAPGSNVALAQPGNDFATVRSTDATDVSIADTNGVNLGQTGVGGNLTISAGGAITQSGALTVANGAVAASFSAALSDVTLTNAANNFSTVAVPGAANATITDANAVGLGTSAVSGNLTVSSTGSITQSGPLTVDGASAAATFNPGAANSVTLNDTGNDFRSLHVASATNASVTDSDGIDLGAATLGGTLTINAGGAVTQSGALSITGAAAIAGSAIADVTLTNAANDFSTIGFPSARDVFVTDANSVHLGTSAISRNATVNSSGTIDQGAGTSIAADSGTATFGAGATHDITLDSGSNDFGTVSASSGRDVTIVSGPAAIGTSTISRALSFSVPGGAMTQTGPVTVTGHTSLSAGGTMTLESATNDFSTISFGGGGGASVVDTNAVVITDSTMGGNLHLQAGGAITQTGPVHFGGISNFNVPAGTDITLTDPSNTLGGVIFSSGRNASLAEDGSASLFPSTLNGNLDVTAGAGIDLNGGSHITGVTTLNTPPGADVFAADGANDFGTISIPSAHDAFVSDNEVSPLILGTTHLSGELSLGAYGLSQTGPLTVAENARLSIGGFATLNLPNPGNDLGSVTMPGSVSVGTIHDATGIVLGDLYAGDLTIDAGGPITQTGFATLPGPVHLSTTSGPITLTDAANAIDGPVKLDTPAGENATVLSTHDLSLGTGSVGGSLSATSKQDVRVPAAAVLTAAGPMTLVSDAQALSSPQIGDGGVRIGAGAQLSGAGALAIYSAKRSQNAISPTATLNGATFTPGTQFVNSAREVWKTYFPAGTATAPFTIFYKDSGPAPFARFTKKPKKTLKTKKRRVTVSFRFVSSVVGSTFLCKVDKKPEAGCKSPRKMTVGAGKHTLRVRARAPYGVTGRPAAYTFKVVRKKPRR